MTKSTRLIDGNWPRRMGLVLFVLLVTTFPSRGQDQNEQLRDLVSRLDTESVHDKHEAFDELKSKGPSAKGAVRDLIERTRPSRDAKLRRDAIDLLKEIGRKPDKEIEAQVIKALKTIPGEKDTDWRVRRSAADALAKYGARAREAVLALNRELSFEDGPDDKEKDEKRSVLSALWAIGPDTGSISPLLEILSEPATSGMRQTAVDIVAMVGFESLQQEKVVAMLFKLLKDDQSIAVRVSAIDALKKWGSRNNEDIIDYLINKLENGEDSLHRSAIDALAQLFLSDNSEDVGHGREKFALLLEQYLDEPGNHSFEVRRSAVITLGWLRRSKRDVFERLMHCIDDEDWQVSVAALDTLGQQGLGSIELPEGIKAVTLRDRVKMGLDNRSWEVRRSAANTLAQINYDEIRKPIGPLLELLQKKGGKEKSWQVRQAAAAALARIRLDVEKEEAKQLKDSFAKDTAIGWRLILMEVLGDADPVVSQHAAEALASMNAWAVDDLVKALVKEGESQTEASRRRRIDGLYALRSIDIGGQEELGVETALPDLFNLWNSSTNSSEREHYQKTIEDILRKLNRAIDLPRHRVAAAVNTIKTAITSNESKPTPDLEIRTKLTEHFRRVSDSLESKARPSTLNQLYRLASDVLASIAKNIPFVVGCIVFLYFIATLFILLPYKLINPLARIKASEWYSSDLRFNIKLPGFDLNTGELLWFISLNRFLGRTSSALDAWVVFHTERAKEIYRDWKTRNESDAYSDTPKANDIAVEPGLDHVGLEREFVRDRFCLLMEEGDRSLQDEFLRQTSLRVLEAPTGVRSSSNPMLPVFIETKDHNLTAGQDDLVETVRGQLRVLLDLENAPSRGLVETLLRRRRILLFISCPSKMIATLREVIDGPTFPANAVIIVARSESAPETGLLGGGSATSTPAKEEAPSPPNLQDSHGPRIVRSSRILIALH